MPRYVEVKVFAFTYLSGTSGRQKQTQECTSAKLNFPVNFNMFNALNQQKKYRAFEGSIWSYLNPRCPVLKKRNELDSSCSKYLNQLHIILHFIIVS